MPNNGRIYDWKKQEFKCESFATLAVNSGVGTPTYSHSANLTTNYIEDVVSVLDGITMSCGSSYTAGGASWEIHYYGPGAAPTGYHDGGATYLSSVSVSVVFNYHKTYSKLTGSLFRCMVTDIELYVNGVLSVTFPGGGYDLNSTGVGPNYVQIVGIPALVTGNVGAGREGVPGWSQNFCDPGYNLPMEYETHVTGGSRGGWRFMENDGLDVWSTLEVLPIVFSPPSGGVECPFGLSTGGVLSATNTWEASINSEARAYFLREYAGRDLCDSQVSIQCLNVEPPNPDPVVMPGSYVLCGNPCGPGFVAPFQDVYKVTNETGPKTGNIRLVPNLEKKIEKIGLDYRANLVRNEFPATTASTVRNCKTGAVESTTVTNFNVHPAYTTYEEEVLKAESVIEEPLGFESYAPCGVGVGKTRTVEYETYSPSPCTGGGGFDPNDYCSGYPSFILFYEVFCPEYEDEDLEESVSSSFPATVGAVTNYQDHANDEARYLAHWCNPHWHYFFDRQNWAVDGDTTNKWINYWGLIKSQFGDSPGASEFRNRIILSVLENDNGNTPFLDGAVGGLRWVGAHRFQTDSISLPSSRSLTQAEPGLWYPEDPGTPDCAIALGATIVCNAFNVASPSIYLELGDWGQEPYLQLLRIITASVDWDSANISAMSVKLVAIDGEELEIATSAGTYDIDPTRGNQKYAGTWAIDNGAGSVTDLGSDETGDGISTFLMSDPETVNSFELGVGGTWKSIKFTFTPIDDEADVEIYYPSFTLPADHPAVYWETSKTAAWLWPGTPYLRWGQTVSFDVTLGFQDPPLVAGLGVQSTIIDWFAFKYRVLLGTGGGTLSTTITTDIASLFDSYEGQSIALVDKFSLAVPLPKTDDSEVVRAALINSFSELPPLACFPFRSRDPLDWSASGTHEQIVFDWTESKNHIITRDKVDFTFETPSNVTAGSILGSGVPAGWKVWEFEEVLDNTETNWQIKVLGTKIANVRPWYGWFFLHPIEVGSEGVVYCSWKDGRHFRASLDDAFSVETSRADNMLDWQTLPKGFTAEFLGIDSRKFAKGKRVSLTYSELSEVFEILGDNGLDWNTPRSITTSGGNCSPVWLADGRRFIYWVDGTVLKGEEVGSDGTVIGTSGFPAISGVSDFQFGLCEVSYGQNRRKMIATVKIGANITEYTSFDGRNWSFPRTVGAGSESEAVALADGRYCIYWHDGVNILGEIVGSDGSIIGTSGFTAISGADAGLQFGAAESSYGKGRRRIVIEVVIGGILEQFTSDDGINFTMI